MQARTDFTKSVIKRSAAEQSQLLQKLIHSLDSNSKSHFERLLLKPHSPNGRLDERLALMILPIWWRALKVMGPSTSAYQIQAQKVMKMIMAGVTDLAYLACHDCCPPEVPEGSIYQHLPATEVQALLDRDKEMCSNIRLFRHSGKYRRILVIAGKAHIPSLRQNLGLESRV